MRIPVKVMVQLEGMSCGKNRRMIVGVNICNEPNWSSITLLQVATVSRSPILYQYPPLSSISYRSSQRQVSLTNIPLNMLAIVYNLLIGLGVVAHGRKNGNSCKWKKMDWLLLLDVWEILSSKVLYVRGVGCYFLAELMAQVVFDGSYSYALVIVLQLSWQVDMMSLTIDSSVLEMAMGKFEDG